MSAQSKDTCYLVTYRDQKDNSICEIKVGKITDSSLGLGFICLSEFLFEKHSVLIHPEEEDRQKKFENIRSLHLSIYSVISIAEVGATPSLSFKNDKAKLLVLQSTPNPDNSH